MTTSDSTFNGELLSSIFRTSKKTIQEYVREIERNNRYRSVRGDIESGYILDDRSKLIDLYDACLQQDAHIRSVIETLESQILGDRYMLARINEKGKYIKDVQNTQKIQGSQFDKIIKGIVESKLYGYTLLEIMPTIDPKTGKLALVGRITQIPMWLPSALTLEYCLLVREHITTLDAIYLCKFTGLRIDSRHNLQQCVAI